MSFDAASDSRLLHRPRNCPLDAARAVTFWRDCVSTGLMNGTGYGAAQAQWLLRHRQQFKPKATKKGEYQKGLDKAVICDQDLDFREFGIDND